LFRLVRELTEAWNRGEFEGESDKIKSLQNGFQACLDALGLVVKRKSKETLEIPSDIHELAEKRWRAKVDKNWGEADEFRDKLLSLGWIVKDGKEGFELAKSE
jgi:cysteinyl-tRNA synthetase